VIEKLVFYKSYLLFGIWIFSIIILFFMYLNNSIENTRQDKELLIEIKKSNKSMELTAEMRPVWTKLLSELEARQHSILEELDDAEKLRVEIKNNQVEIIKKLDALLANRTK
jgi:hypothetical protein